jgi:hypothetical protein
VFRDHTALAVAYRHPESITVCVSEDLEILCGGENKVDF